MADADSAPEHASEEHVDVVLRLPLKVARSLLQRELETLAAERAAHACDVASYEAVKARVAVTHFGTYVKLDVGGAVFKTSVSTLRAERGSTLAAMFSGSGLDMTLNDEGAYFIDRDGAHFRHILNYLRGCFDPSTLSDNARRELLVEADFYMLRGLCHALTHKELPYSGNPAAENGVMYWLGTARGSRAAWHNPAGEEGGVILVSDMPMNSGPVAYFTARAGQYSGYSGSCNVQPTQYIRITLPSGVSVVPSHYSLRYGGHCNHPLNWKLEAAEAESAEFVVLREHVGDTAIQQNGNIAAWPLTVPGNEEQQQQQLPKKRRAFSVFRFTCPQGGCFHASCFEVYGTVRDTRW